MRIGHVPRSCRKNYVRHGAVVIVLLGGGDKSSQQNDIEAAKRLAANLDMDDQPKA